MYPFNQGKVSFHSKVSEKVGIFCVINISEIVINLKSKSHSSLNLKTSSIKFNAMFKMIYSMKPKLF